MYTVMDKKLLNSCRQDENASWKKALKKLVCTISIYRE